MSIALRTSRMIPLTQFLSSFVATGALALLEGETEGFAIDATTEGGTVAVIDLGTPANNLSNVAIDDASILVQSSASDRYVQWDDETVHLIPAGEIAQEYDLVGGRFGILIEREATNLALHNNDLTNAAWTKVTMTTALTATGPDNVANSATTCTATSGNATALQSIVDASTLRITSAWIKRRTGSGNIDMTQNNGTTWTTVAVTSAWTKLNVPSATAANPIIGIRIVTSGDAVDVWGFQQEDGDVVTSTIATTTVAVTRGEDKIGGVNSDIPQDDSQGTIISWYRSKEANAANPKKIFQFSDGTANERVVHATNSGGTPDEAVCWAIVDGGSIVVNNTVTKAGSVNIVSGNKVAGAYQLNNSGVVADGSAQVNDTGCTMPTTTIFNIGHSVEQATRQIQGYLYQIRYIPRRMTEAEMQVRTTS